MNKQDLWKILNVNIISNTDYSFGGIQFIYPCTFLLSIMLTHVSLSKICICSRITKRKVLNSLAMIIFPVCQPSIDSAHPHVNR